MSSSTSSRLSGDAVFGRGGTFHVPNAAELIAQDIRSKIVRGQLREGDALPPEQELTDGFGVSRPVLRQALRILESERLLGIRRGQRGGPVVRRPDPTTAARHFGLLLQYEGATLEETFQARRLLEEPSARRAAEHPDPELVAALRANLEAHAALLDAGDGDDERLQPLARDFHHLLMRHVENTALVLFDSMLDNVIEMASRSLVASQETSDATRRLNVRSLRSHQKLLDMLVAGDADAAEELWRRHLDEVAQSHTPIAPRSGLVVDLMTS